MRNTMSQDAVEEHGAPDDQSDHGAHDATELEAMRHYADRVLTDCPNQDWDLFLQALGLELEDAGKRGISGTQMLLQTLRQTRRSYGVMVSDLQEANRVIREEPVLSEEQSKRRARSALNPATRAGGGCQ